MTLELMQGKINNRKEKKSQKHGHWVHRYGQYIHQRNVITNLWRKMYQSINSTRKLKTNKPTNKQC